MPADDATSPPHRSSRLLLIVSWLIVVIPAAWGVTQTAKRSMDLFTAPTPAPTTAPVEAAPPASPTTTPA